MHSTLVPNKPKIRDGFQPWSSNELALVLFKFRQFPKVASIWRRHIDQLRPRYPSTEDDEPGENYTFVTDNAPNSEQNNNAPESSTQAEPESSIQVSTNSLPHIPVYGPSNPRRSTRTRKQKTFYGCLKKQKKKKKA